MHTEFFSRADAEHLAALTRDGGAELEVAKVMRAALEVNDAGKDLEIADDDGVVGAKDKAFLHKTRAEHERDYAAAEKERDREERVERALNSLSAYTNHQRIA